MIRIGVDVGGTKIEAGAVPSDGRILHRRRVSTAAGDYAGTIATLVRLVTEIEAELGRRCPVGIGMPGALSPATGLVKNANSTCLNGRRFDRDLEAALGRPLRFANDANCFALSEARGGAAEGAAVAFGAILGTGVGGGIVVDAKLLVGQNAIAGEWGHSPLPWPRDEERPGPPCYCGRHGCIESFLSGPGLAAAHRRATGEDFDAAAIAARAAAGDRKAEASLTLYEDRLARSLALVVNLLDPDVIVLGGGLGQIGRLYERVPQRWRPYIFSDVITTRLVPPRHGDASGVRGAAWLWDPDETP